VSWIVQIFRTDIGASMSRTSPSIREGVGSESDRLTECSASIVVADKLVLLFEHEQASPLLAGAIETALQRQREVRAGHIQYLLYRLAKTVFVDNYFNLMRQGMVRVQDLEGPLLEGSTDAKIYREVARQRRELNPLERSLLHMGEFLATVAGDGPEIPAGLRYVSGNLADDTARLDVTAIRDPDVGPDVDGHPARRYKGQRRHWRGKAVEHQPLAARVERRRHAGEFALAGQHIAAAPITPQFGQ